MFQAMRPSGVGDAGGANLVPHLPLLSMLALWLTATLPTWPLASEAVGAYFAVEDAFAAGTKAAAATSAIALTPAPARRLERIGKTPIYENLLLR